MNEKRFWYGHLDGDSSGAIVIWDRMAYTLHESEVYLYHSKKDKIIKYKKDIVRKKLKPLSKEEYSVIDAVLSRYFEARSKLSDEIFEDKLIKRSLYHVENDLGYCNSCNGTGQELSVHGVGNGLSCSYCGGSGKK